MREELRQTTAVTASSAGEVIEVKAYAGAMVAAGTPLVTIQATEGSLEALVYVPASEAKYISRGLDVQVSPSTTRRAQDGYLLGTVESVTSFPVTPIAISRRLENDALTAQILSKGPVSEIRVALHHDRSDPTGYQWSSKQGRRILLSSGALCASRIITARQRPLSLAIPMVREALGVN
jgi:HlyD family secretion protein